MSLLPKLAHRRRTNQQPPFLSLLLLCTYSYVTILLVLLTKLGTATALIVTPLSGASDYRQLASLLVSTFDAPPDPTSELNKDQKETLRSKLDLMQWNLYDKSLTEQFTYKQYTSTVKRMWGKKYCLFVAKEHIPENEDNGSRSSYNVVGVVEMGMSLGPVPLATDENGQDDSVGIKSNILDREEAAEPAAGKSSGAADSSNSTFPLNNAGTSIYNPIGLRPRATVGVLCVESTHQKKGIGQALLRKCEEVASDVWNEQCVFVDVEPDNLNAMSFFERCGYSSCVDETGSTQVRNATVSRRRIAESRPHFVLEKRLGRVQKNSSSNSAGTVDPSL